MFSIEQGTLLKAIQTVMPAIPSKSLREVYGYILLVVNDSFICLTGTNGEITIQTKAKICSNGMAKEVLLPAQALQNIVRRLPKEEVTFNFQENCTEISCGRAEFQLQQADVGLFPKQIAEVDNVPKMGTVTNEILSGLISKVIIATDRNTSPMLANVRFKIDTSLLTLEGTDGRCLARVADAFTMAPSAKPTSVCIPLEHVGTIARLANGCQSAILRTNKQQFVVCFDDDTIMVCPCAASDLPPFDSILPTGYETTVEVIREELLATLERVGFIAAQASGDITAVSVSIQPDNIKLSASSCIGSAEDVIASATTGAGGNFHINPRYLIEPLKSLSEESIRLGYIDASSPVGILTGAEHYTYIAMPVINTRTAQETPEDSAVA